MTKKTGGKHKGLGTSELYSSNRMDYKATQLTISSRSSNIIYMWGVATATKLIKDLCFGERKEFHLSWRSIYLRECFCSLMQQLEPKFAAVSSWMCYTSQVQCMSMEGVHGKIRAADTPSSNER